MKKLSEELREYAEHRATPSGMKIQYAAWADKAIYLEGLAEKALEKISAEALRRFPDHPPHPRRNDP